MTATTATVFVVVGESGEYSGREHWLVRAFLTEVEANEFRDKCEAFTKTSPPEEPQVRRWAGSYVRWPEPNPETYDDWLKTPEHKVWQDYYKATRVYWVSGPDPEADSDAVYRIDQIPLGQE